MKIGGCSDEGLPIAEIRHRELAEIVVIATPAELRRIAAFLGARPTKWSAWARPTVEHLCDRQPGFGDSPQWVVVDARLHAR